MSDELTEQDLPELPFEVRKEIFELAVDGISWDGSHHKRWFFEEIAKAMTNAPMQEYVTKSGHTHERRTRKPLQKILARFNKFFEDDHETERPEDEDDYWELEPGIAP